MSNPTSSRRRHAPLIVVGTLLASSLVLRCAKTDDSGARLAKTDAAVTGQGGQSQIWLGNGGTGGQGFVETAGNAPVDSGPSYACRPASVAEDCPPPAPMCDGATSASFSTPRCVDGHCQWTREARVCAHACVGGSCDAAGDASNGHSDAGGRCTDVLSGADGAADANASVAGGCDIPPAVCLSQRHMLYFVDPRCVDGACRAVAMLDDCNGGWCVGGACEYNFTR
jgi:hypothetical protein